MINAINENINKEEETYHGLKNKLKICVGAQVMLRNNLWTEKSLVNGALGVVEDIVFHENQRPPNDQPAYVMVRFYNYTGPSINGLVPIPPIIKTWFENGVCKRTQIPLTLAWATTIHKSQGLTLERAQIDIGPNEMSLGITYVALSRVRTFEGLMLLQPYEYQRFSSIKNSTLFNDRKTEEERLANLN